MSNTDGPVAAEMLSRLEAAFKPQVIEIVDDSESHRGHGGYQEGGESHFIVTLVSSEFAGMGRVARHRAVHAAIGKDLMGRIHALALNLSDGR